MNDNKDPHTASPRALRLKTEAGNCLTIAMGKSDPESAAELIDEAVKLMRRAKELSEEASRDCA